MFRLATETHFKLIVLNRYMKHKFLIFRECIQDSSGMFSIPLQENAALFDECGHIPAFNMIVLCVLHGCTRLFCLSISQCIAMYEHEQLLEKYKIVSV